MIFTKSLDPEDLKTLPLQIVVEEHFDKAPQHPMRHWEYGMCLAAAREYTLQRYIIGSGTPARILDVGGHGSPLEYMLKELFPSSEYSTVDPNINSDLHTFIHVHPGKHPSYTADIVTSISVIEHTKDVEEFAFDLAQVTAPGGLLFLTMDYWDQPSTVKDSAHYHWMRERIFCPDSFKGLIDRFHEYGFSLFGDVDWDYHGSHLFGNYTFQSLAMVKNA